MYKKYAKLRDKAGLTDYRVAKESGIVASTFSDWKSGRSKPKVDKLQKIATVIQCKLEELLD